MSAGLISRFGRCFLFATGKPHPSRQARLRGRRPLLCSAARCIVRNAQSKKPCQPKTAKRFFGGPGSHGPSGQAKERTRILPVRRGSFCPACRAMCRAGRSCAACRFCAGLCDRCPGVCSLLQSWRPCVRLAAIVSAFCGVVFRPTRRLPLLRPACAAPPRGLLVVCPLCAEGAGFLLFFTRSPRKALPFSAGVSRLCSPSEGFTFCRCCGGFCTRCLFALRAALDARFSFVFCLFLFGCCRANFFSFVAQAATGIFFLARILRRDVPARGSCHLLLFRGLLRPLPVFPFYVVRADFLSYFSLVFLPFPA